VRWQGWIVLKWTKREIKMIARVMNLVIGGVVLIVVVIASVSMGEKLEENKNKWGYSWQ